ncbi:hypothetical protein D1227_13465 [Henriciella mobilis]|nr:hypothetical protein D1231_13655 [Henriciella mobilis]RIJ20253.1 hypothetical protein D1227_13465 [Henriciella mobilis]
MGQSKSGTVFDTREVSRLLSDQFGLDAPEDLINYWVGSLLTHHIIEQAQSLDSGDALYVWSNATESSEIEAPEDEKLGQIANSFEDFRAEQDDLLLAQKDIDIISIIHDELIIELTDTVSSNGKHDSEQSYIFGRFTEWLANNRPDEFEYLSEIRHQAIMVELILNLFDSSNKNIKLNLLNIYLDSPIVMDLVGLSGPDRKRHSEFLVKSASDAGAVLLIADPHLDEIYSNIDGVLNNLPHNRYGPTAEALRRGELSEDTIGLIRGALPRLIEDAGVKLDSSIEHHVSRSPLNEDFSGRLYGRIQSYYRNLAACERDIQVVRGVMGRRGPKGYMRLADAKAVFVTQNSILANVSNSLAGQELNYRIGAVPLVIARSRFSAMMMSLFGLQKSKEISKLDLLVAARSAISYNPGVLEAIAANIKKMSIDGRDDIVALLKDDDFARLIMDTTKGVPANATAGITNEIIQRARHTIAEDVKGEIEARYKSSNARFKRQAEQEQAERKNAENRVLELEEATKHSSEQARRERREIVGRDYRRAIPYLRSIQIAEEKAKVEYFGLMFLLAGSISAATILFDGYPSPKPAYLFAINAVIVVFLTYVSVFNNPLKTLYSKLRTADKRNRLREYLSVTRIPDHISNITSLRLAHREALRAQF